MARANARLSLRSFGFAAWRRASAARNRASRSSDDCIGASQLRDPFRKVFACRLANDVEDIPPPLKFTLKRGVLCLRCLAAVLHARRKGRGGMLPDVFVAGA